MATAKLPIDPQPFGPPQYKKESELPDVKTEPKPEPDPAIVGFDHTVPYPQAPEVDHGDESQEHYSGARDPEQSKSPFPPLPRGLVPLR